MRMHHLHRLRHGEDQHRDEQQAETDRQLLLLRGLRRLEVDGLARHQLGAPVACAAVVVVVVVVVDVVSVEVVAAAAAAATSAGLWLTGS